MKSNLLVDIEFMCKDTTHNSRIFKTKLENSKKTLRKNQNRKKGNNSNCLSLSVKLKKNKPQ